MKTPNDEVHFGKRPSRAQSLKQMKKDNEVAEKAAGVIEDITAPSFSVSPSFRQQAMIKLNYVIQQSLKSANNRLDVQGRVHTLMQNVPWLMQLQRIPRQGITPQAANAIAADCLTHQGNTLVNSPTDRRCVINSLSSLITTELTNTRQHIHYQERRLPWHEKLTRAFKRN